MASKASTARRIGAAAALGVLVALALAGPARLQETKADQPPANSVDASDPLASRLATTPVDDDIAKAIRNSEKLIGDARLLKSGRLSPPGDDKLPVLKSPVDAGQDGVAGDKPAGDQPDLKPSEGTTLLDRMGLPLPELPPEKPFTGVVDEAYGAFQRGYYLEAMDKALARAQKGDAAAQTLVAEMFASGLGVKRNVKDAAFWYEQAAKGGDANAQYQFALLLMDGGIVKLDKARADAMMMKAAEGGNKYAQFNIAQLLVAKQKGPEGLLAALPWYEKAAIQGVPDAQYAMSQLLLNLDLPKERRMAARDWLEKAARGGFDTAQYDMGVWLINGIGGERDFKAGFKWMKIAADNGHVLAMNKLAHLFINGIGTGQDAVEAAKYYVLSRRAGLKDLDLEDFYLGIDDSQQKEAIARADRFRQG